MRKLGMIGGMSWVSTHRFYERVNRIVQRETGAPASAPMLIESLDFASVFRPQSSEEWDNAVRIVAESGKRLADAGAEMLVIGANSMHKAYAEVQAQVEIPVLHIAECVGRKMKADGVQTAVLVGTKSVMTESFYRRRLVAHDVDLIPPDMDHVEQLDRIIYEELMVGKAKKDSGRTLRSMFTRYEADGAKAVVLANTELELIVDVDANVIPIYDCMGIYARAAADWIMGEKAE
ncbi:aspartate/glutamate racemase family protein [Aurantiacibacter aquimixticola]|uniref:Amino acid racemase n=1 Tax=Aurantiacibacter aquimixticola TaxID=1958945 RepID=A0A419RR29_9SPHN|nr:amino acid racemase [Aurantiacibacter aquimixticola]RJY08227.1 amino acid racemase [Aurantiacibacter aquimixticola]